MEHKSIILYFIIKKKREYFVTVAWIWDEHIKVSYFCFNSFEFEKVLWFTHDEDIDWYFINTIFTVYIYLF